MQQLNCTQCVYPFLNLALTCLNFKGPNGLHTLATLNGITHWKNYSWRAHVRVGEAEGDPEGDGRRTLANGWESRLWRLEDKHLREGSSVRQFGRPRPLRIRHRRRRMGFVLLMNVYHARVTLYNKMQHRPLKSQKDKSLAFTQTFVDSLRSLYCALTDLVPVRL